MRRAERAALPRTPRTSAVMTKRVMHLEPENSFKQFTVFITAPGGVAEPVIYFILGRQALTNAVCTLDERRKFPKEVLQCRSPQNFLREDGRREPPPRFFPLSRGIIAFGGKVLFFPVVDQVFLSGVYQETRCSPRKRDNFFLVRWTTRAHSSFLYCF